MGRSVVVVLIIGLGTIGCGTNDDESDEEPERDAALHIMVEASEATNVGAVELVVADCDDGRTVASERAAVDVWSHEQMTPSHIGEDDLFIEEYRDVPAGCYDVEVELLNRQRAPVDHCTRAVGRGVEVDSGETAEVMLFSRCGDDDGPRVEMLQFEPSARTQCDQDIDVCATVDAGGSEVAFNWQYVDDEPRLGPFAGDTSRAGHRRTQCARWRSDHHGEVRGLLEAYPARAETTDDGETVLFASTHQVEFGLYVECPDQID